jgi:hypothetical protein
MPANSSAPSSRPIRPSSARAPNSSEMPIRIGTSRRISCVETTSGASSAQAPRMNSTLKMLEPTTLPTAMSELPLRPACRLTASSGELVPNATTVRPITSGEMPAIAARDEAPRTRSSPPTIRKSKPPTSIPIVIRSMRPLLFRKYLPWTHKNHHGANGRGGLALRACGTLAAPGETP